jgi:hypothetical protein
MSSSNRRVMETVRVGATRYQLERVRCGKERCRRCGSGDGHGPYWYAYRRQGTRTARAYRGRAIPDEVTRVQRQQQVAEQGKQALTHEGLDEVVAALEELGALLCRCDDERIDELDAWELQLGQLPALTALADDIEQAADDLRDAASAALRRVRRHVAGQRRLVEHAEELLELG